MLSTTSEYALRAMVCLARAEAGQFVLARDLAEQAAVPPHYLSKVLAILARGGLLQATRGSRGGYRLSRPASEVRLIELVEQLEGPRCRPQCLLGESMSCSDETACSAHSAWKHVRATYITFLEQTTLAAISTRRERRARGSRSGRAAG